MRTRRSFSSAVVCLLIACVLCALLPATTPASKSRAARSDESYRCSGHRCGCADAVACRSACCCADDALPEQPRPAHPDQPAARGLHHALLEVLGCRGGLPAGVASGGFNAVLATPFLWEPRPAVSELTLSPRTDTYVSWKPDPCIPPPRGSVRSA